MVRKFVTMAVALMTMTGAMAQNETEQLTVFRDFRPGIIHLANGKELTNPLLNVFLKNSSLLYKRGSQTMEANMDNIVGVDFSDRKYVKVDNKLAYLVDTVGQNKLYCATLIDVDAYQQMLRNNRNITNIDVNNLGTSISGDLSYTTIDLASQNDILLPVISQFYILYNGEMIKAHEREIYRRLSKEQKRMFKTIIGESGFSWVNAESLMKLLKAIS